MKVLFYGTPEFALPSLDVLLERHEVVAVVTQPDRRVGRGLTVQASPVKRRALAAGLPVIQPDRLRDPGWPERLRSLGAEVAVVAAFGQILPKAVLEVSARGSINVHASLLPRYRGAAPVAWAIIRGETVTGVTTFRVDPGMDTGDILLQRSTAIEPGETAGQLTQRLSRMGGEVLCETLDALDALTPTPQNHALATQAPRLKREDGWLRLSEPAADLVNRVHGANPSPGAAIMTAVGRLLIWRAAAVAGAPPDRPGTLVPGPRGSLVIATGAGLLEPIDVQAENRKAMTWAEFLRGARLAAGSRVGEVGPALSSS